MRVGLGAAAAYAAITLCAGAALADFDDRPPSEPRVRPTLFWALTQLVPSPEGVVLEDTATSREVGDFGVRWQVTPLLYAWDMHRGLSPWRTFVVEPSVRSAGSIELYLSPELVTAGLGFTHDWFFRPGVRAYFPLLERGEALSCSVGGGLVVHPPDAGASIEGGVYTLVGAFGLVVAHTPAPRLHMTTITFAVRYF